MSLWLFSALAAAVTVAGFATVVWISRLADRMPPSQRRRLAVVLLAAYAAALLFRPAAWPVIDLAVLAGAIGGVLLFERGLQTAAAIVVFVTVAGLVDFISMMSGGLSKTLFEHYQKGTSSVMLYLSLVWPVRGHIIPIVGISDLFIGGSAAAALMRIKLPPLAVMLTMSAALLIALAVGLWRGGAPALPFLAAAVWLLVWRHSQRLRPH
jgi:hypothetical protein